jgi:CRISPR-associated protein Cmr6
MAQAAVPERIQKLGFSDCPPGHRFNLYLQVWNAQWGLDAEGSKAAAAHAACAMPASALALLKSLHRRQVDLARALGEARCCVIEAETTAPFATGLGLEHPIENGFSFMSPYGLPYLAGSGVKGVLRRAAEELAIEPDQINALFGPEDVEVAQRGVLTCWDVFPRCESGMTVEIMTPHFSGYYQDKDTPHDAGSPNPIPFLAVPAGTKLDFVLTIDAALLPSAVGAALVDWQAVVRRIVAHAFNWLGFGAKTAVGYGAMREDPEQQAKFEREQTVKSQALIALRKAADDLLKSPEQLELEQAAPLIEAFRVLFTGEKTRNQYKKGNEFDPARVRFIELARKWSSAAARGEAATLLRASFKFTEWPGKADRKAEVKRWLTELDGQP